MATARAIIRRALRKASVLSRGMPLSAEDANDGLEELNGLLASWSTDGLAVLARVRVTKTLSTGVATYTIGSGGDIDTARPLMVDAAYLRVDGSDYPVRVIGSDRYDEVVRKGADRRPTRLYYEPGVTLGTIFLDGEPTSADVLHLTLLQSITAVASLDTEVAIAREAEDAVVYNLAVRMAPEYGKETSRSVTALAVQTKGDYECWVASFRVPQVAVDPTLRYGSRRFRHFTSINDPGT